MCLVIAAAARLAAAPGGPGLLDRVALAVTYLGSAPVVLLLTALYLWAIDRVGGRRLALLLGLSYALNHLLKATFDLPRPFDVDPAASFDAARATAAGAGWPSGHAQAATVFWGSLAARHRRAGLWALAAAVVVAVAASRVVLGVHYPADVAGGFSVGLLLVALSRHRRLRGVWGPGPWPDALAFAAGLAASWAGPDAGWPLGLAVGAFLAPPDLPSPGLRGRALTAAGGALLLAASAGLFAVLPGEALRRGAVVYALAVATAWTAIGAWPAWLAHRGRRAGRERGGGGL